MKRVCLLLVTASIALGSLAAASSAKTVWLCKPGQQPDPCSAGVSTTIYSPTLHERLVEQPSLVGRRAIDCFYVYPTVSGQPTGNANLHIDPAERSVAFLQAARYSQYCRVFAPMYRQVTLAGLGGSGNPALALAGVRAAFQTYLHKFNHGRGFVLIGHSQGSFMLRQLIARDIDPQPAVRRRLISAILLGGNVLVRRGSDIGGDFNHIPACHSASQLGCVIAFSTFNQPVPTPSLFGRPSAALGTRVRPGEVVLCTNPAALAGGSGRLDPIFPSSQITQLGSPHPKPRTTWSEVPGSYRARCSSANHAHVLQIAPIDGAPVLPDSLGPAWGLHLFDANIALGNLVSIVRTEAAAFLRSRR